MIALIYNTTAQKVADSSVLHSPIPEFAGDINLIPVINSHNHNWLENILLGRVAEKELKHTTLPLFIVPTKKRDEKI